jgi:hypothetical protein
VQPESHKVLCQLSYFNFTLILWGFLSLGASSVSIEQDEASSVLKNDGSEYLFKHAPAPATSNLNNQTENYH